MRVAATALARVLGKVWQIRTNCHFSRFSNFGNCKFDFTVSDFFQKGFEESKRVLDGR